MSLFYYDFFKNFSKYILYYNKYLNNISGFNKINFF